MVDPIQKYTDLTYGILLLAGLVSTHLFDHSALFVGLGIGIFIGYAVHVGSKMVEFSSMQESVESVEEKVESVEDHVETVEESTERTAEQVEEVSERVEETKETTKEVRDTAKKVEGAVNGGDQ